MTAPGAEPLPVKTLAFALMISLVKVTTRGAVRKSFAVKQALPWSRSMCSTTIHDLPEWRVTSYVNGLAYSIEWRASGQDIFFQGDDVAAFRNQFDKLTSGVPALGFSDALQVIWTEYAERLA